ncbi:hypothetical protein VYU27_009793, partial [Nannochloropsis oceanica]
EDALPEGGSGIAGGVRLLKGTDVFISTWSLHRSETLWESPNDFKPERWLRPMQNPGVQDWGGYDPSRMAGLYPNEVATDFAFLPFGGGARKCIGDQFAIMETTVIIAMLLRQFDFTLHGPVEDVGMRTGATIHTEGGLRMTVKRRSPASRVHVNHHPTASSSAPSPSPSPSMSSSSDSARDPASSSSSSSSSSPSSPPPAENTLRQQADGGCPMARH